MSKHKQTDLVVEEGRVAKSPHRYTEMSVFMCVYACVHTHLPVYNTQGVKGGMGGEEVGPNQRRKKNVFPTIQSPWKDIYETCQKQENFSHYISRHYAVMMTQAHTHTHWCKHIDASFPQRMKRTCKILVCRWDSVFSKPLKHCLALSPSHKTGNLEASLRAKFK